MIRRHRGACAALLAAFAAVGCRAQSSLPPCEWCGAMDAPPRAELSHIMTIPDDDEPGVRITLRGRVFQTDGVTPAPGVLVYAYHTDIDGVYRRDGDETGNGRRHGALRGWLVTDEDGRYEIRTIRPNPYPSGREAAHIHVTLTPSEGEEHWIDSFLFHDDDLVTNRERRESSSLGRFNHIVTLAEDESGGLVGERDLRLRNDRRFRGR